MLKFNPFSKRSLCIKTAAFSVLVVLTLAVVFFVQIKPVLAQVDPGLENLGQDMPLGNTDPRLVASRIIRIALSFLGIIAVGLILWAGYLWMTSGGDVDKVGRAKKILINAVIGLAIILSAWGIVTFIIGRLIDITGAGDTTNPGTGGGVGGGALGNGIIQSHYPDRDATDIPRNTKIIVTFKEAMDVSTIMDETSGQINDDNIKIYRTYCTGDDGSCQSQYNEGKDNALTADQVKADKTEDDKTFIFDPVPLLGSDTDNIWYTVYLGSGLAKANGQAAFGGGLGNDYDWKFEVSNELDLTAPWVINSWPKYPRYKSFNTMQTGFADFFTCLASSSRTKCGGIAKNAVPYIDFNEPIDPTLVTGTNPVGITAYTVDYTNNSLGTLVQVPGIFTISNGYKTVSFMADSECGTNSCGDKVYCLPADANIIIVARAATLLACDNNNNENDGAVNCQNNFGNEYTCDTTIGDTGKSACHFTGSGSSSYYPESGEYDGIMDVAGNSLDGNKPVGEAKPNPGMPYSYNGDKSAQGSSMGGPTGLAIDDFYWYFFTTDQMDVTPPQIEAIDPSINDQGVTLDKLVEVSFSELIMKDTLKPDCKYFNDQGEEECFVELNSSQDEKIGFWVNSYDTNTDDQDQTNDKTKAQIKHGDFSQATTYTVGVTSNIKDSFQNCFQPCQGPGCSGLSTGQSCCNGQADDFMCQP